MTAGHARKEAAHNFSGQQISTPASQPKQSIGKGLRTDTAGGRTSSTRSFHCDTGRNAKVNDCEETEQDSCEHQESINFSVLVRKQCAVPAEGRQLAYFAGGRMALRHHPGGGKRPSSPFCKCSKAQPALPHVHRRCRVREALNRTVRAAIQYQFFAQSNSLHRRNLAAARYTDPRKRAQ